jgi:hypothetical protein
MYLCKLLSLFESIAPFEVLQLPGKLADLLAGHSQTISTLLQTDDSCASFVHGIIGLVAFRGW